VPCTLYAEPEDVAADGSALAVYGAEYPEYPAVPVVEYPANVAGVLAVAAGAVVLVTEGVAEGHPDTDTDPDVVAEEATKATATGILFAVDGVGAKVCTSKLPASVFDTVGVLQLLDATALTADEEPGSDATAGVVAQAEDVLLAVALKSV
jgi:hypothetical protein